MHEPITGPVIREVDLKLTGARTAAARHTRFAVVVSAELRKLTDTLAGRLLLLATPPMILLMNILTLSVFQDGTVSGQIGSVVIPIELGQFFAHAALIRSITGEWLYGGIKGTLLVQPSRMRYVSSQVSVAGVLWLGCAAVQILFALVLGPMAAASNGVPYLLGDRWAWVVAVCLLGSLLGMLAAISISLMLLNPSGALAAYFVTVPVLVFLASVVPRLSWINPFTPATELATLNNYATPAAGVVSLALWIILLSVATRRICRMDIE